MNSNPAHGGGYIGPLEFHDDPNCLAMFLGGFELERDDDYLRQLLLDFEASDQWMHYSELGLSHESDYMKRHFHIQLLVDGGLMAPIERGGSSYRITNQGHDFIAMTREDERWAAVKAAGRSVRGASVQMLYRLAEGMVRQKLVEAGFPLA
ncbi:DUF2513 domain-containing protein [Pseudooceanicola sp.]|uniref:DUF2513 domain-containing protein n=1 Tax=Pseudooceanicola sp. TaxID=1914328 RepID=UPI0035C68069